MHILTLIAIASAVLLCILLISGKRYKLPLPPGPPAIPVIGHLLAIPSANQENFFYNLGKIYGDIIHLHIPGRNYIVLNSVQAAVDLLEKRSHNYSGRPNLPVYEIMGWTPILPLLQTGPQFRLHRRMMQEYLSKKKCISYRPIQAHEARVLLQNLLSTPDKRDDHLSHFSSAVILRIAFGYQISSKDDAYLKILKDISRVMESTGSPGGTPVDFFPFLQHLPSWFPGTYYAEFARGVRPIVRRMYDFPLSRVQEQMAKGNAKPSFMSWYLEALNNNSGLPTNTIFDIQGAVAAIYGGAAETTWSSLSIFFLAMTLYPDCQARAQEEIDAIIGTKRLPEFEDRESLPYVECLIQETLRWNHAVPLGVPHRSLEDDVYNGMLIPKGSIVIANTRGISLDERVYTNPLTFDPSRYLPKPAGMGEPYPIAHFGFGRRICPGRHFADPSLWISISSILATMQITKALDDNGKEIIPEVKFTTGGTSRPMPFQCNIRPRNENARSLITELNISDPE